MTRCEVPRGPASALMLTDFAADRGLTDSQCLRGTGLSPGELRGGDTRVTPEQEIAIIGNLADRLGNHAGLGVEVARRYHVSAFGIWNLALLSSPTVRAAMSAGLRFGDLAFTLSQVYVVEDDRGMAVSLVPDESVPPRLHRFVVERDLGTLPGILREALGLAVPFDSVTFTFAPPDGEISGYTEVFGVTPEFNAAENRVVAGRHTLDQELPGHDEARPARIQEQCEDLLPGRTETAPLLRDARQAVLRHLGKRPSSEELATALNLSERTLRRRLAEHGTTYRALVADLHTELAKRFLAEGLTVAQTAHRLGYDEPANLGIAFKRWTGMTPTEYTERSHGAHCP
jgi:AraC-like DNA-binding protein